MNITLQKVVRSWRTKPELFIPGYLWGLSMFGVLAFLEFDKVGLYLVPPFGATLFILLFLPDDAPIAQPYALIVGSVVGASVGTVLSLFARGLGMAVLAAIVACLVICVVYAFHPPAVALALYSVLFHPGNWFPLVVVLPLTVICGVFRNSPEQAGRQMAGLSEALARLARASQPPCYRPCRRKGDASPVQ